MKIFHFCLFILYTHTCLSSYLDPAKETNTTDINDDEDLGQLGLAFLQNMMNYSLQTTKQNLTDQCYGAMTVAINDPNQLYLIKLYRDSAKNKNDLGSYLDCFTINYRSKNNTWTNSIKSNLTYIVVHINKRSDWYNLTDIRYETGNFLFGACIIKGCSTLENKILFESLNNQTGIFPNTSLNDIQIFDWGERYNSKVSYKILIEMIPVFIVFFFMLWSFFPSIPLTLFKSCFKRTYTTPEILSLVDSQLNSVEVQRVLTGNDSKNESDDSNSKLHFEEIEVQSQPKIKYDQTKLNKLEHCFVLLENADEILNNNISIHNVNVNNDSGLSIVKGLRGFNIILTIAGSVFKILYNSPIKIFCNVAFRRLLMGVLFTFIQFGIRFCPGIFFSVSGYCLMYKFLCYLDNEVEKIETENRSANLLQTSTDNLDLSGTKRQTSGIATNETMTFVDGGADYTKNFNSSKKNTGSKDKIDAERNTSKMASNLTFNVYISHHYHSNYSQNLQYSSLFYFMSLQTYKFIFYVMSIIIFKFSYYNLISVLYSPGPMWGYLKEVILNQFTYTRMIARIFLFSSFSENLYDNFDIFYMATNEIFYFILFSILIFVFYKKNWRFDLFIIISFFILIITKLSLFLSLFYFSEEKFYPSMSYNHNKYFFIQKNPFYNMPSFLIGLLFGSVNYCIQKSISSENFSEVNKNFLCLPCKFRGFFTNNQFIKVFFTSAIFGILFLTTIFGLMIIYNCFFLEDLYMNQFYSNLGVNLFFLFDIEFGILLMYLILIPLFLMGDNFIISFLSHEYWNFLSRPYFNIIISLNLITLYVFYQSESRVKLESFNIIFFSLLVLIIILILCGLFYILFEVPMKKLNKYVIYLIRGRNKLREEMSLIKTR